MGLGTFLSFTRSLSGRLLILTVLFVMLAEVLIFLPSVARFRMDWLAGRLVMGQIAALALEATPDNMVSEELRAELLANAEVISVALRRGDSKSLVLTGDRLPPVEAVIDIRDEPILTRIREALRTMIGTQPRFLSVRGTPRHGAGDMIDVVVWDAPLMMAIRDYAVRILLLSLFISALTAGLVYLVMFRVLVKPMRRITANMMAFRADPEDASRVIVPRSGHDEIAQAERELAAMQADIRASLKQKARLAALGGAVAKINHDLRNMLASAQLVSDRLGESLDPTVQRLAPRLVGAIDRAIGLATDTLRYGRAEERPPAAARFALDLLAVEVAGAAGLADGMQNGVRLEIAVAEDFAVVADRDHLFRVLLNLVRNAVQALEGAGAGGTITLSATRTGNGEGTVIEVRDDGPGLPESARAHLFEAFVGSARAGGTGLGLAIARDLMRLMGGDVVLAASSPEGTVFRLTLRG